MCSQQSFGARDSLLHLLLSHRCREAMCTASVLTDPTVGFSLSIPSMHPDEEKFLNCSKLGLGPVGSRREQKLWPFAQWVSPAEPGHSAGSPPSSSHLPLLFPFSPPFSAHLPFFLTVQDWARLCCKPTDFLAWTAELQWAKRGNWRGDRCSWELCSCSEGGEWDKSQAVSHGLSVQHMIPPMPRWVEVPRKKTAVICACECCLQLYNFVANISFSLFKKKKKRMDLDWLECLFADLGLLQQKWGGIVRSRNIALVVSGFSCWFFGSF